MSLVDFFLIKLDEIKIQVSIIFISNNKKYRTLKSFIDVIFYYVLAVKLRISICEEND